MPQLTNHILQISIAFLHRILTGILSWNFSNLLVGVQTIASLFATSNSLSWEKLCQLRHFCNWIPMAFCSEFINGSFVGLGNDPKNENYVVFRTKMVSWFCWPLCIFHKQQWGCSGAFYVKDGWRKEDMIRECSNRFYRSNRWPGYTRHDSTLSRVFRTW